MTSNPILTAFLYRVGQSEIGTFGVLVINNRPVCVTLERPWADNDNNISCIPAGTYRCTKHSGAHFEDVWQVLNVPGRKDILIHWGNSIDETKGCIIAALAYGDPDGTLQVQSSKPAIFKLRKILTEDFDLVIINPRGNT